MSLEAIIQSIEVLTKMHEKLIHLSEQKTEMIKDNAVDALQSVLNQERTWVQKLDKAEEKRQESVVNWLVSQQLPVKQMTITNILEHLPSEEEKVRLESVAIALTEAITTLKQHEQLNQELLMQSMQFVQLSLDMLSPSIQNMNYGKKQNMDGTQRSVFDSQA